MGGPDDHRFLTETVVSDVNDCAFRADYSSFLQLCVNYSGFFQLWHGIFRVSYNSGDVAPWGGEGVTPAGYSHEGKQDGGFTIPPRILSNRPRLFLAPGISI